MGVRQLNAHPVNVPRWMSSATIHRNRASISASECPSISSSLRTASAHSSRLIFCFSPNRSLLGQLIRTAMSYWASLNLNLLGLALSFSGGDLSGRFSSGDPSEDSEGVFICGLWFMVSGLWLRTPVATESNGCSTPVVFCSACARRCCFLASAFFRRDSAEALPALAFAVSVR